MTVALILAAGSGERLGAGGPKALVELAGRPLLQWSIEALRAVGAIEQLVVAMPAGAPAPAGVTAVTGGATRSESVRLALAAAGPAETVLVHDAARPLLSPALAERVIAALQGEEALDAAIAAVPVTDTVKRVGEGRRVQETLDRSLLWAVQTPQVFRRGALERALDVSGETLARATDDAWLIEQAGGTVLVVRSGEENLKVTTPHDLRVAELLLAERARGDAAGPPRRRGEDGPGAPADRA
jgi:2-C-methyl-D-erythritol 4-phosphate cytidylyltransferase